MPTGSAPESDTASVTTLAPPPEEDLITALATDQTGVLTLTEGTALELSFERHEDVDQFNFFPTAGATYRLSMQMIWPRLQFSLCEHYLSKFIWRGFCLFKVSGGAPGQS